jgi:hypothetical protein
MPCPTPIDSPLGGTALGGVGVPDAGGTAGGGALLGAGGLAGGGLAGGGVVLGCGLPGGGALAGGGGDGAGLPRPRTIHRNPIWMFHRLAFLMNTRDTWAVAQ